MSAFLSPAIKAQGLSVLDPAVPWMLGALLLLAFCSLWFYLQPERRALRPLGPASRLPWPQAGALMLGSMVLFGLLAWGALAQPPTLMGTHVDQWDLAALGWARGLSSHGLYAFAVRFTEIGSVRVLMPIVVVVALWLMYRQEFFLAAVCVVSCSVNSLLLRALKLVFERTRPPHEIGLSASGYSFPSGHAAGASMVIGLLIWLLHDRVSPAWRLPLILLGCLLILSISASRVLLQVHFLSDVFAGLLLGAFSLTLTIAVTEHVRENRPAR